MKRTVGVITNPTSGSGRGRRWSVEAMSALAERGLKVRDLSRGSWGGAYETAMKARSDLDALVVVGGDGMVHLGAQICAGRKKLPLGIMAAGSGNDAAVTYGLPVHDMDAAADRIAQGLEGDVTPVDLGKVKGRGIDGPEPRYFTCVLSAGIDAAVAQYARGLTWPRGPMKYKYATMREVPRFKPYGVTVQVGNRTAHESCTLVAVANAPIFGGGLYATPDATVTDGRLEVVLADGMSRTDILRLFPKLNDGSHVKDPRVHVERVAKVTISQGADGARLPAAFADGELVGAAPLEVEVAPGALRVLGAAIA